MEETSESTPLLETPKAYRQRRVNTELTKHSQIIPTKVEDETSLHSTSVRRTANHHTSSTIGRPNELSFGQNNYLTNGAHNPIMSLPNGNYTTNETASIYPQSPSIADAQKSSFSFKSVDRRRKIILISLAFVNFCAMCAFSLLAPFFPIEVCI